jgi:DNA-binding HxlR family transcriptional regulator
MKRTSVGHRNCSVARSLDVIGEWWTLLIVRDIVFGVRRFEAIQADLGVARNILADRLATLVDHDVLARRKYQDGPERFEYVLTDKGEALFPVLLSLMRWGDEWQSPKGAPLELVHVPCASITLPGERCSVCHEPLSRRDLKVKRGPGFDAAQVAAESSSVS